MGENKPSKLDLKTDFFKDKVKVKAKGENSGPVCESREASSVGEWQDVFAAV